MNYKLQISVAMAFLLGLVLQACSPTIPETPVPPASESRTIETELPPTQEQGLCSHPLYPVETGATWTYQSIGGLSGNFSFTDTITEVREDGFTLESEFNGATVNQQWSCTAEGLASLTFGSGAAGGLSTSGVQMDLTTTSVQGVILPRAINPGDQWPYSLDFEGEMTYSGTNVETQGTATFAFSALGEESVTVPAGTFNALKIHADLTLEMDVTYSGFTAPVVFIIPSDIWYAPDVGWVKATSSGDIFGLAFNESIELQYYSIP